MPTFEQHGRTYQIIGGQLRGPFVEVLAVDDQGNELLCIFHPDGTLKRGAYEPLDTTWPKARAADDRIHSVN